MKICQRLYTTGDGREALWTVFNAKYKLKWLDPVKILTEGPCGRPPETGKMPNLPSLAITRKELRAWKYFKKCYNL